MILALEKQVNHRVSNMELPSLKLTAAISQHLKMDGWKNTSQFPFGAFRPIFSGKLVVSFREYKLHPPKVPRQQVETYL